MDIIMSDYIIALQQAIEHHCKGKLVPNNIANKCPHHVAMLNYHLIIKSSESDKSEPSWVEDSLAGIVAQMKADREKSHR